MKNIVLLNNIPVIKKKKKETRKENENNYKSYKKFVKELFLKEPCNILYKNKKIEVKLN